MSLYAFSDGSYPAPADAQLSLAYIESLWVNAGGDPAKAPTMAAIAYAESSGVPNAINPTDNDGLQTSWGLWQISNGDHSMPANWDDPQTNAKLAVGKVASQGLGAWGTYNSGAYLAYLPQASSAANSNPFAAVSNEIGSAWNTALADAGAAWNGVSSAIGAGESIVSGIQNVFMNPGPLLVGLALLAIGGLMISLSFGESIAESIEKFVGAAAPVAGAAGAAKDADAIEVAAV